MASSASSRIQFKYVHGAFLSLRISSATGVVKGDRMHVMKLRRLQSIIRAYGLSIALWCALSLLTGVQYRVFDKQLNIPSSLSDMILLAESRGFAFAMLTPPIFYLARRYIG